MAQPGKIVLPVRIDDGERRRQFHADQMVVEHDHFGPGLPRGLQRLETGRAAIDSDDQARALLHQFAHRLRIGAIALENAVGDVDLRS